MKKQPITGSRCRTFLDASCAFSGGLARDSCPFLPAGADYNSCEYDFPYVARRPAAIFGDGGASRRRRRMTRAAFLSPFLAGQPAEMSNDFPRSNYEIHYGNDSEKSPPPPTRSH